MKYLVHVTDTANLLNGWWHSTGTAGQDNNSQVDPYSVTLTTGAQSNNTADFGYYVRPAAVGNFVWNDLNANGIQDAGEPGLNGVEVTLTIGYPNSSTTTVKVTTGNDPVGGAPGWYSFGNLLQDENFNGTTSDGSTEPTYTLSINTTQPALAGMLASPLGAAGSTIYNDSNDPAASLTVPIKGETNTLLSNDGASIASYDFGFYRTGIIRVDKVTDPAGAGHIFSYTLTGGPRAVNIPFTQTDAGAPWSSGPIAAGAAYSIEEQQDTGWTLTSVVCNNAAGQPISVTWTPGTGIASGITLAAGDVITCVFNNAGSALAVDLAYFAADLRDDGVHVVWETVSETNTAGFNIYRAESADGLWVKLSTTTIAVLTPGGSSGNVYEWVDAAYTPGQPAYYILETIGLDGSLDWSAPLELAFEPQAQ